MRGTWAIKPAMPRLNSLCFGLGYSARALGDRLTPKAGRSPAPAAVRRRPDCLASIAIIRSRRRRLPASPISLFSIPPDETGRPGVNRHGADIAALPGLAWLGYPRPPGSMAIAAAAGSMSGSELRPSGERGRAPRRGRGGLARSVAAVRRAGPHLSPCRDLRAGPQPIAALRAGTARRIDKPGQVFSRSMSRISASVLVASIARPRPGAVYNVCDDEPAAA